MNFTKLALTAVTSLGLLAAAPAAFAIPFTVTSAKVSVGDGYGTDASEHGQATKLDVKFTETFKAQDSLLNFIGDFMSFDLGTVQFAEPDSGNKNSANFGIKDSETDGLGVSWAFTFTDSLGINQSIAASATAYIGEVGDSAVDYTLDWTDLDVYFGTGGQFRISLNDLSFSNVGTQTQKATITLLKLPTLSSAVVAQDVPEPASLALVGLALAGLAITRRRKPAAS